jgi:hypothetical protein
MRHGISFHGTWKEICLGHMELISSTDRFPSYLGYHACHTMHYIERFVVLLYDRTSPYMGINEARKKLFAKRNSVQRIPPTYDALEQHMKRSLFQGGYVWGQVLVPQPVLPSPTSWGWRHTEDGSYEPLWTTLPEASKSCLELVSCGCKKGCRNRCKCKNANLQCTGLCVCEGECQ